MKKKSAFSLLELVIVMAAVGLVMAAVLQGVKLIRASKISAAQTLTKKSPVLDIDDLALWYETSLPSSFAEGENRNNSTVSIWYDSSLKVASNKNNATSTNVNNRPKYLANFFNDAVPAVQFNTPISGKVLFFNGNFLIGTSYTIFVVEQRSGNFSNSYFIGSMAPNAREQLLLGYRNNTTIRHSHYLNGSNIELNQIIPAYSSPQVRIHTFLFDANSGGGKKYWENGGGVEDAGASGANQKLPLVKYDKATIGYNYIGGGTQVDYRGSIGEIIIFTRALKNKERQRIENYLSKKFSIKIS